MQQILGPLRNVRRVVGALLANFVLVPLVAVVLVRVLPVAGPLQTGLLLLSVAAGAPFLIKLTEAADGDVALSAALLVLLLAATVVSMPGLVPLLAGVRVSMGATAAPLILNLAAVAVRRPARAQCCRGLGGPVAAGVRQAHDADAGGADRGQPPAARRRPGGSVPHRRHPCDASLDRRRLHHRLPAGGGNRTAREVLGLGTGQRNIAAAVVVATQSFEDPAILVMVAVSSLVSMAVLVPVAWTLGTGTLGDAARRGGSWAAHRWGSLRR